MPKWIVVLAIGGTVVLGAAAVFKIWPVINVVETGKTTEYPDVVPRQYSASKNRVFDASLRAAGRMPRWAVVSSRQEQGDIRAEAKTMVWRFVDDVVIRVTEEGGRTAVNVRSASRVGRGDFGQNARNIRAFFLELDRQLATGSGS
jgi:uncharacterized protein (DUF1499 family)